MFEYSFIDSYEREDLFAELIYKNYPIGEICVSDDKKSVRIIFHKNNEFDLNIDCAEFIEIVQKAYERVRDVELEYWKKKTGKPEENEENRRNAGTPYPFRYPL